MTSGIRKFYIDHTIQEIEERIEFLEQQILDLKVLIIEKQVHTIRKKNNRRIYQKAYYEKRKQIKNKIVPFSAKVDYNYACSIEEKKISVEI